jgi:diguanylate cyclase
MSPSVTPPSARSLPAAALNMKADLINPVVAATVAVFGQRLAAHITRGEPYLRHVGDREAPIVAMIGVAGETRAIVLLGVSEAVAAGIARGLEAADALSPGSSVTDALAAIMQWIAERVDSDRHASLPVVVHGGKSTIEFPAGLVPLCIPFTSPWGGLTLEIVVVEQVLQDDPFTRASEILGQIQDLTTTVAQGVGRHYTRVGQINDDLKSSPGASEEDVLMAVARLIEANEHMHRELTVAEEQLLVHARAIEAHVAEARSDALTGLLNRRALEQTLRRFAAEHRLQGKPVSLMLIDIDHFKRLNDTHGHPVGDAVLKKFAAAIRESVRGTDIVARYGGDELTVVFPDTDLEPARLIAEEARQAACRSHLVQDGTTVPITASAGLAQIMPGEQGEHLLNRADMALYASKRAGRNCQFWHDGQHARPMREESIDAALAQPAPLLDVLPVFKDPKIAP